MTRLVSRKQFALRGFIRCGKCDCAITAERKQKKLKDGTTAYYDYYHCTGKRGCEQRRVYVRENELWKQLNELLDTYELIPQMYDWAMDSFRDFAQQEVIERNSVQVMQQRALSNVQTQLDKLLDMATRGLIDDSEYKIKSQSLKSELKTLQEDQADTAHRVKNWYEVATDTFKKLTYAGDKFKSGDVGNKKDILLAIGQNPIMIDGKLTITPNEWLIPVGRSAKGIREALEKVRTEPQQIQKASEEALSLNWCGWGESNSRLELGRLTY